MIGSTINQYHIIRQLGQGGMGVVYLAEDTRLHRHVALKFVSDALHATDEERTRFDREAQAAARLNHPNICTVYELAQHETDTFIALEYVEGRTLAERIRASDYDEHDVRSWLMQIAQGLGAAHAQGVIHRDIKPANVMIVPGSGASSSGSSSGRVKIMDFGIAKLSESETALTQAGSTIGTIAYMSPEQALGGAVDARSDIWSVGVVLYELLTGERPFQGHFREAVLYAMLHTDPEPVTSHNAEVSSDLAGIVERCLCREVDERYGSMEGLLSDLRESRPSDDTGRPASKTASAGTIRWSSLLSGRSRRVALGVGLGALLLASLWLVPVVRGLVTGGGSSEALPSALHLAVLPFDTVSGSDEDRAFSQGLAHLVATNLMRLEHDREEFWIIPVREVLSRGVTSAGDARDKFGINLAISGTIVDLLDVIQITLDVTDAQTLRVVSSARIELAELDAGAVQEEVLGKLAGMLGLVAPSGGDDVLLAGGTSDPEAYKLYIQGQGFMQRYDDLKNIDEAIKLYERAIAIDTTYALAYAGVGYAYARKYRFTREIELMELASQRAERAVALNDQLSEVWVAVARTFYDSGKYGEAVSASQNAYELDPDSYDVNRMLAVSLAWNGDYEKAEPFFEKAIALQPNYWDGYNALALMYSDLMKEPARAIPLYEKVIELSPDNPWGYNNLGGTYLRLGDTVKVEQLLLQSIEIEPILNTYNMLGWIAISRKAFDQAVEYFLKAVELAEEHDRLWMNLGNAYLLAGDIENARKAWQQSIDLVEKRLEKVNSEDVLAIGVAAEAYARLGHVEIARRYIERYLALSKQDADDLFELACLYEYVQDREQALFYMQRALEKGYDPPVLNFSPWLDDLRADPAYQALIARFQ